MKIAFTLCSNNYFAQALVLAQSFSEYNPEFTFVVGLVDRKSDLIDYDQFDIKVIEVEEIEPDIHNLAFKYDIVELNTAVKPHFFLHFIKHFKAEQVFYLDPDICVYQSFGELSEMLYESDILLTPHILKPIKYDQKKPFENDFLNYGIYNLGFLGIKRTMNTLHMLHWWKERTYNMGYHRLEKGLFVDQLWMNLAPILFESCNIITNPGYNMGPWNLHERNLQIKNNEYYVNKESKLYFYHFSNLSVSNGEIKIHSVFDRFSLENRTDLVSLYTDYVAMLESFNFFELKKIPCHYTLWRGEMMLQKQNEDYRKLSAKNKMLRRVKNGIPVSLKNLVMNLIKA